MKLLAVDITFASLISDRLYQHGNLSLGYVGISIPPLNAFQEFHPSAGSFPTSFLGPPLVFGGLGGTVLVGVAVVPVGGGDEVEDEVGGAGAVVVLGIH